MQVEDAANEVRIVKNLTDTMDIVRTHCAAVSVMLERRKTHLTGENAKSLIDALSLAHHAAEEYFGLLDELGALDDVPLSAEDIAEREATEKADRRYVDIEPRPLWFTEQ